jgi:hypothetical protein
MALSLPVTTLYTPGAYQKLFCKLDGRLNTQVTSISLTLDARSTEATTMVKGYDGETDGAPIATATVDLLVPYILTDASGGGAVGLSSAGIVTGKGVQLSQQMLTNYNANGRLPVSLQIQIGQPASQKFVSAGYFHQMTITSSDGANVKMVAEFRGSFGIFQ